MNLHLESPRPDSRIGLGDGQRLSGRTRGDNRHTNQSPLSSDRPRQQIPPGFHLLPNEGQLPWHQVCHILTLSIVPALTLKQKCEEIRLYISRNILHALLSRLLQQLLCCCGLAFFFEQSGMLAQNGAPLLIDRR
jgi:hypothetical protein